MSEDLKPRSTEEPAEHESDLMDRRDFLLGLKKWSKVVIGSALFGGVVLRLGEQEAEAGAWANARGGGGGAWANRAGGGGGAWANRAGGGGGGAWANSGGAWANRGSAWANAGGAWANRF